MKCNAVVLGQIETRNGRWSLSCKTKSLLLSIIEGYKFRSSRVERRSTSKSSSSAKTRCGSNAGDEWTDPETFGC